MRRSQHLVTVAFADCDPQGIVNYPNYFQWFDRGHERLFREAGLAFSDLFEEYGIDGVPLVEASSTFLAPARMGDSLVIDTWIEAWREKSFSVRHHVTRDGEMLVDAREVRAWVVRDPGSSKGIRAARVPEEVRRRFAP